MDTNKSYPPLYIYTQIRLFSSTCAGIEKRIVVYIEFSYFSYTKACRKMLASEVIRHPIYAMTLVNANYTKKKDVLHMYYISFC